MKTQLLDEAVGGLSAGIIGTIIGFPLDVVKTHMQTSSSLSVAKQTNILAVARDLVQREGIGALYRGVAPPLLSLSILNTFTFSAYSYFQHNLYGAHSRGKWHVSNAMAGATCAPFAALVSTVENLVKTQMQLDRNTSHTNRRQFQSSWDCFQQLRRTNNHANAHLGSLYTGHGINTAREVTFLATYFFMYEGLRTELSQWGKTATASTTTTTTTTWYAIPAAGGLSGAIAWTISFPLDCIRAGVQGQTLVATDHCIAKQKQWYAVTRQLLATKGIRGLYAGASASILRAFLVSGTRFSAYEGALWLLRGGRDMDY